MEKSGKPRSNFLCTPPLRSPTLTSYSPSPFSFSFTISLHFLFPRLRSPHFLGFPPCSLSYPIWQGVIDNRRKEVSSQFIRDRFLVTESKWTALNVHVHPNKGCSLDTLYLNIDVSLSFFFASWKTFFASDFRINLFFFFYHCDARHCFSQSYIFFENSFSDPFYSSYFVEVSTIFVVISI